MVGSGRNSITSKLLCMSSLPAPYETDLLKNIQENVMTSFSNHKCMGLFSDALTNSKVHGQIWTKFELMQALMYVMVNFKYKKDPIKNCPENVMSPFYKL